VTFGFPAAPSRGRRPGGPSSTVRLGCSVLLALAIATPRPVDAGTVVTVGASAVAVREKPEKRATCIYTAQPRTELDVLGREGDWYWVVVPPDADGIRRSGWVRVEALADTKASLVTAGHLAPALATESEPAPAVVVELPPSTNPAQILTSAPIPTLATLAPEAEARADLIATGPSAEASTGRLSATTSFPARTKASSTGKPAAPAAPPQPVGGASNAHQSALAGWIIPRSLRASFGAGYQSANSSQDSSQLDERLVGGGGTIAAAFAVLDPRILTVDFAGDLQANRTTRDASLVSSRNTNGLRSYRLEFGILTGRSSPLRVYTDRFSSDNNLEPFGSTLDPAQRTRGVRSGTGFSWDINAGRLPRIQVTASTSTQTDEQDYLFGYNSTNQEQRAEIRASRDYIRGRYDLDFIHNSFLYEVPTAGVRSDTGNDLFMGTGRLTPSDRLTLDFHGRASRFRFGSGSRLDSASGGGADGTVRYKLTTNVEAMGRYSFSTNAFQAMLSGQLGAGPAASSTQLMTQTLFQDGEARVQYSTRPLTAAVIVKGTSYGTPPLLPVTLGSVFTVGGLVSAERTMRGITFVAGGDGSAGPAQSSRSERQPYREAGVHLGITRDFSGGVRLAADGAVRRVGRLDFYPVTLDAKSVTLGADTTRPGWARLHVAATWFDNLRDVSYSDAHDRHVGYAASVSGRRYDVSADYNQTDANSLLLPPSVLGSRPEVLILMVTRPDLFRGLVANNDTSRSVGLQLRPVAGLQIQGRARWQEQSYPDVFGYVIRSDQVWAVYQVRDVQLEFGWEYLDSTSSFGHVRDRRIYVKIRRDLVFF